MCSCLIFSISNVNGLFFSVVYLAFPVLQSHQAHSDCITPNYYILQRTWTPIRPDPLHPWHTHNIFCNHFWFFITFYCYRSSSPLSQSPAFVSILLKTSLPKYKKMLFTAQNMRIKTVHSMKKIVAQIRQRNHQFQSYQNNHIYFICRNSDK